MKRIAVFAVALSLAASPAAAQEDLLATCSGITAVSTPTVPGGVPTQINDQFQFLCGQVVNALTNVQPTFGIAFSGGAHTLGTSTTIGRRLGMFPRISVTARFNAALAQVPDLLDGFDPTLSGGEVGPMGTVGIPVGSLQGDVVVGLLNGASFGPAVGGVGAVDLLGSVSYVPIVEQVGLTQEIINAGIGARVGILKQGLLMPGISVSAMYRTMLGDVEFGSVVDGDPAEFSTNLSTLSLRAGVSKGLLMFDVNAGAGYDIYSSDVAFDWKLTCPAGECMPGQDVTLTTAEGVSGELKTAAWNVHANVGMSLLLLNIVGEVGYQKATEIIDAAALSEAGLPSQAPTDEALEGGRFFVSIGIRLTL
jgi:hypothetical protein